MRTIWNVVSDEIEGIAAFYADVLGFAPTFESDWYIQLAHDGHEIGVLKRGHTIDPTAESGPNNILGSTYPTFVVDDLAPLMAKANTAGAVVSPPADMFYGQRRAILRDPDGRLIDVSMLSPT